MEGMPFRLLMPDNPDIVKKIDFENREPITHRIKSVKLSESPSSNLELDFYDAMEMRINAFFSE